MLTFSINTLGCKVNQYESQQVRELLESFGLRQLSDESERSDSEKPDLLVINTCCVTHTASAKSRQCIRKHRKLFPDAVIVVCGCLAALSDNSDLPDSSGNIIFVPKKDDFPATLSRLCTTSIKPENNKKIKHKLVQSSSYRVLRVTEQNNTELSTQNSVRNNLPQLTRFDGQTRAFIKVQDGCDGFCTYCIVPKVRPVVRYKPLKSIINEAKNLIMAGHKEIVLSGIFLGAYGQKTVRRIKWPEGKNDKLADLLNEIAAIENLHRIRLSSLEPADVTEKLLDIFRRHKNIMPHFHLPLQSGSDAVLKRMCRQYNTQQFREKVQLIKSHLDRPAVTTDIIVGFPGETEEDFEQTIKLVKEVGFAKTHIFRFSARQGTAAAKMSGKIDNKTIKQRSEILNRTCIESGFNYRQQFIGTTTEILIEDTRLKRQDSRPVNSDPRLVCGRSERYFMVSLPDNREQIEINEIVKVKLIKNTKSGMIGKKAVL